MQARLVSIKDSTHCQITPAVELDILQKVRSYVSLNEDYQVFITNQRSFEGAEIPSTPENASSGKITYQKALKLQSQARESQIPDDIPVLRKLNQSILKYEKFIRECADYQRFLDKIGEQGMDYIKQI